MDLALELSAATGLVAVTVLMHLGGIALLLVLLRRHRGMADAVSAVSAVSKTTSPH